MISVHSNLRYDKIKINEEWNDNDAKELIMHSIHAYPAKFPAFIAEKAFEYAKKEGVDLVEVADIFCGCGTVALEAKRYNLNFWGCDINPVATLIARVKSNYYKLEMLDKYYCSILDYLGNIDIDVCYDVTNERIKYWFARKSYDTLYKLKKAIQLSVKKGKYRDAFLCIFSSVLKAASKWLTKSIKPQIDPNKKEIDILKLYDMQYKKFVKAIKEINYDGKTKNQIMCQNFLNITKLPKVDMVITSPPYVTSYEYADLHQLSSLWLEYVQDFRELRKGSIGSIYNSNDFYFNIEELNDVGQDIVNQLMVENNLNAKVKSVARYYRDIQVAIKKCFNMLNENGMAFFVVGDTEYKGVKIENSRHLVETLIDCGFKDIKIGKRKISNKLLTPYRNKEGKFTSDKTDRTIYHEEFIISGRKLDG